MSFAIRRATRQGVKPLIGLYSESGCGKTFSSLLLARGFVGPSGKIVLGDTESGRGELYADVIPGGYEVVRHDGPFSPKSYVELVEFIEAQGAGIGIIDSASHEWEGLGGVLEMASENEAKSGKPGLHCWKLPKLEHQRFMLRLLQSKIPWIINLRAKYKSRQVKENGKTAIIKDDFTTPIQADDFIFEMTVHGEILPNHSFRPTKVSHPALAACFPKDTPIEIRHGELLAQWCSNPATGQPADPLKALRSDLWKLLKPVRGMEKDWKVAQQWLWDEAMMDPMATVQALDQPALEALIAKINSKLNDVTP